MFLKKQKINTKNISCETAEHFRIAGPYRLYITSAKVVKVIGFAPLPYSIADQTSLDKICFDVLR